MSIVKRKFKLSVALMIQKSKTYRTHLINRLMVFTVFDSFFDNAFITAWQNAVEAAEGQDTDETRDDQSQTETVQVLDEMTLAQKKYIRMKYFIEKAFPASFTIQNEFGLNTYSSIRDNQQEMVQFLGNLHNKAENKYKAELLAVNCTQAEIDQVDTIKNSLDTQDQEQEVFIDKNPLASNTRNTAYNNLWDFAIKTNRAAHVLYADDYDTLNLFLFPRGEEPDESFSVLGVVKDAADNLPLAEVEIEVLTTPNTYATVLDGLYGFVLADGEYDISFKKLGYVTQIIHVVIVAGTPVNLDVLLAV